MNSILQSANIKSYKNDEYNNPDWYPIFKSKEYKSLNLAGQIQKEKYGSVKCIEIK